jgi:hypothetical protein
MGKIKVAVTTVLFVASCALLLAANGIASAVLSNYTPAYPASFGQNIPRFSAVTVSLMQNSAALCFGVPVFSAALAFLAISRAKSSEARLYWVTVLAVVNYHVGAFLLGAVAVGFFLLPKLANGT